jgi:D-alanine transfer protein
MKKVISLLIPIIIAIFTTIEVNSLLDKKIELLVKEKNISEMGKVFSDNIKDKSSLDKKLLSDEGDLFLLGSSEMGTNVPQNPLNFFPFKGAEYDLSCFGRAYSQSLQQATYLGGGDIKDKQKVVYVLSIQWFEDQNAVEPYNFAVNFSEVQFYKFLKNPKISEANKRYYAERVYRFLTKAKKYSAEAYYAKIYLDSSKFAGFEKVIFKPYYEIKQYLLDIQDKALIYEELKNLPDRNSEQALKEVNWNDEYSKIEKENESIVSTNQFNLDDKYYNNNLKSEIDKHKGESVSENLMQSKEVDDYKFFLSVCKDLDIEPYVVLPPVNGWYYDYVGLTKDKRDQYYQKVGDIAKDNGLDVLDLHSYDYTKYFLIDPKHLGKEGWLKVSEEIYKHFNQQ